MTEAEGKLFELMRERCYTEGEFTLSSGAKSNYYFDGKLLEMSSEGAPLIGQVIYERTKDLDISAIGGLETGAIPLTTAAVYVYHEHGKKMEGFFVRNEPKKHGTKKIIEGRLRGGSKVAVVEDVITKGSSVLKAVDAVKKAEAVPVVIIALVDRLDGAAEKFAALGIPYQPIFTITDFIRKSANQSIAAY